MEFQDQQVSKGSSHISKKKIFLKDEFMIENMQYNMAFEYKLRELEKETKISEFKRSELLNILNDM